MSTNLPGKSYIKWQATLVSATKEVKVEGSYHCGWLDFTDKEGGSDHMGEVR